MSDSTRLRKNDLIEYHITIQNNNVNESTIIMILNELENVEKSQHKFIEFINNFETLSFIYTLIITRTSKKIKLLKKKALNDTFEQKLHKNL